MIVNKQQITIMIMIILLITIMIIILIIVILILSSPRRRVPRRSGNAARPRRARPRLCGDPEGGREGGRRGRREEGASL